MEVGMEHFLTWQRKWGVGSSYGSSGGGGVGGDYAY